MNRTSASASVATRIPSRGADMARRHTSCPVAVATRAVLTLLSILLFLAVAPDTASAERASAAEMRRVCENFLRYAVGQQGSWAGSTDPRIERVTEIVVVAEGAGAEAIGAAEGSAAEEPGATSAQDPALPPGTLLARNYSIAPRGHVVVPVLKELPPIKLSSEDCDIDVTATEGPAALLRTILADRARRFVRGYGSLDAVQPAVPPGGDPAAAGLLLDPRHRRLWDQFLAEPQRFAAALRSGTFGEREQVGPLLTTAWHQCWPYNEDCPMGDGGQCVVGCVATATVQVMRYWAWPPVGTGEFCHEWNGDQSCGGNTPGGMLCVDSSDSYDWANMPDECQGGCSPEERAALAELNYEVGVAEMMDYGRCASGTRMPMVNFALAAYFRYDPALESEYRGYHTADSWFALIQSEINAARPMVYAYIGHAIICDGWRTGVMNEYHMNYGFVLQSYNAWYVLDELPFSEDPLDEMLIRGIMPDAQSVFHLRADGSGDFPAIQEAVSAAVDGNTIELEDGVYSGPGNRDIDLLGKTLTIRSISGDFRACVIDCEGSAAEPHRGFVARNGETPATRIEGLTIRNGYAGELDPSGGALFCLAGSSPALGNCLFMDNCAADRGGAIYCGDGASPELRSCVFVSNQALNEGGAVACDGALPLIEHCCFLEGDASHGSAIAAIGASPLQITNTIIAFGSAGEPVACIAGGSAALACCDVYGNAGGDWVGCLEGQYEVDGNISADPIFCDPAALDFTLATESPCVPGTPPNPECGLVGPFGVGCGTIVVYEDGSGPFPTIQSAINAIVDGETIHLADGTFTGEGNRDIDLLGRAVTLCSLGGDPERCVLDCQGAPEDWHRGFVCRSGEGPSTVIEGLTVQNGYHDIAGAILIDSSSPTLRNLVLADNYADFGGAVRARYGSTPLFERVVFLRNCARMGGGAYCLGASNAVFRNCTFHDNSASDYGAGLRVHDHTNAILENTIIAFSPSGEAISCNYASYPELRCCDLYGNAAGDWTDRIADQYGIEGNISEDPLFCEAAAGDVGLQPGSPCAPYTAPNEECGLLGARWVGCGLSDVVDGQDREGGLDGGGGSHEPPGGLSLWSLQPSLTNAGARFEVGVPPALTGSRVHLRVVDLTGRTICTLIDAAGSAGWRPAFWDGRDLDGRPVPAGLYFLHLRAGDQETSQRILIAH